MRSIGKTILSAFVEVTGDAKPVSIKPVTDQGSSTPRGVQGNSSEGGSKFKQYFDKLFSDANLPGPDYFEFSKMIDAMQGVPDEKARFCAAFAGLNVQGLDREKLLSTAGEYLRLLEDDLKNFNSTIDAALHDKVHSKRTEIEEKNARIAELTRDIADLQNKISILHGEIKENEEKLESSSGGYRKESESLKNRILSEIEKIKTHIK